VETVHRAPTLFKKDRDTVRGWCLREWCAKGMRLRLTLTLRLRLEAGGLGWRLRLEA